MVVNRNLLKIFKELETYPSYVIKAELSKRVKNVDVDALYKVLKREYMKMSTDN